MLMEDNLPFYYTDEMYKTTEGLATRSSTSINIFPKYLSVSVPSGLLKPYVRYTLCFKIFNIHRNFIYAVCLKVFNFYRKIYHIRCGPQSLTFIEILYHIWCLPESLTFIESLCDIRCLPQDL